MCTVQVSSCYLCRTIPLHTSLIFLLLNVFPCSTFLLRDIFLNLLFPFIYIITTCSLQPNLPQYHAHPPQARPALTVDALRTQSLTAVKKFRMLWRKCLSITTCLEAERWQPYLLVISHGEIPNTCKSEIQQQWRFKRLKYFLFFFFKIMKSFFDEVRRRLLFSVLQTRNVPNPLLTAIIQ